MAQNSPIWLLETNLKSMKTSAQNYRDQSTKALLAADECDRQAEIYEKAIAVLKAAEKPIDNPA